MMPNWRMICRSTPPFIANALLGMIVSYEFELWVMLALNAFMLGSLLSLFLVSARMDYLYKAYCKKRGLKE